MPSASPNVAIVDYGMGNLFSVKHACAHVGLDATVTSSRNGIEAADAVIIPGVGAFGDAMRNLAELGLVEPIRELGRDGMPIIGICLGMQLLMDESEEFGRHAGLGLVPGRVESFGAPVEDGRRLKVPQVGWNRIHPAEGRTFDGTPLAGLPDGEYLYFVHSYVVRPGGAAVGLSVTRYGDVEFCSSLIAGNLFACQFHPERSGPAGLAIYGNIARFIKERRSS